MRSSMLLFALLLVVPALAEDTRTELEKLQGRWKVVSIERDGKVQTPEKSFAIVKENKFTTRTNDKVVREGTMKIDSTKKPKTIDATYTTGPEKGKTLQGIYDLDEDDWRILYAEPGKERPKAFPKEPGTAHFLLIFKREKP